MIKIAREMRGLKHRLKFMNTGGSYPDNIV